MDVVKQVEKQKVDIRKILKVWHVNLMFYMRRIPNRMCLYLQDTREMQRTYNNASDTLSRAYATIDEMIFYVRMEIIDIQPKFLESF